MPWGKHNGNGENEGPEDTGPWGGRGGSSPKPSRPEKPDLDQLLARAKREMKNMLPSGPLRFGTFGVMAAAVLLLWLATGFYQVETKEQAAVLRLGKFHRLSDPGLRYALPYPFESVIKQQVTTNNQFESRSSVRKSKDKLPSASGTAGSLMLTGDENIVDVNYEVKWKIRDLPSYLFNVKHPDETLRVAAESAIREVIGQIPIIEALGQGKLMIQQDSQDLLQSIMDQYQAGIEIVTVQLLGVDPPSAVVDAFRDVQNAKADRERSRNEAELFRNDIIPKARGEAERSIQEAEAYKQEVVARSKGEAERFKSVYEQYRQAKDVTRQRIYMETMEEILSGADKTVIDLPKTGGSSVIPIFPLDSMKARPEKASQ